MTSIEVWFVILAAIISTIGVALTIVIMRRSSPKSFSTDKAFQLLRSGDVDQWNALRSINTDWVPSLRRCTLDGLDLQGIDLRRADLTSASFKQAQLQEADFRGAILIQTDFTDAELSRASFSEAKFGDTLLRGASTESVTLTDEQKERALELITPPSELVLALDKVNEELIQHLARNPDDIHKISPRQFEQLIAELLSSYGWDVKLTSGTRDHGYDILAVSRNEAGIDNVWLVECKKYNPQRKIGTEVVRVVEGLRFRERIPNAMIATTSYFSHAAKEAAAKSNAISLKDYDDIVEWLKNYRSRSRLAGSNDG